jgi:hypothetical protein
MSYEMNAEGTNGVASITTIVTDDSWQLLSGPVMVVMDATGGLGPPPPLDVTALQCIGFGAAPAVVGNGGNGPGVVGVTAFSPPPPGQPSPATTGTGKNAGVYGTAMNQTGAGVLGESGGSAPGVHGDSEKGYGVLGTSKGDGNAAGVFPVQVRVGGNSSGIAGTRRQTGWMRRDRTRFRATANVDRLEKLRVLAYHLPRPGSGDGPLDGESVGRSEPKSNRPSRLPSSSASRRPCLLAARSASQLFG